MTHKQPGAVLVPSDLWMQTRSGIAFYPANPKPEQIALEDIAHGIANTARYCGQTQRHYSVAEHSVHLARWFLRQDKRDLARIALLHDAAEAYICDIPRPLKIVLGEAYKRVERRVEHVIAQRFGLPSLSHPEVKAADDRILEDERRVLLSAPPKPWTPREALGIRISPHADGLWAETFLELAAMLDVVEVDVAEEPAVAPPSPPPKSNPTITRSIRADWRGSSELTLEIPEHPLHAAELEEIVGAVIDKLPDDLGYDYVEVDWRWCDGLPAPAVHPYGRVPPVADTEWLDVDGVQWACGLAFAVRWGSPLPLHSHNEHDVSWLPAGSEMGGAVPAMLKEAMTWASAPTHEVRVHESFAPLLLGGEPRLNPGCNVVAVWRDGVLTATIAARTRLPGVRDPHVVDVWGHPISDGGDHG